MIFKHTYIVLFYLIYLQIFLGSHTILRTVTNIYIADYLACRFRQDMVEQRCIMMNPFAIQVAVE